MKIQSVADARARHYINIEVGTEPFPAGNAVRHPGEFGYSEHIATLQAANEFRFAVGARASNAPMREGVTRAQATVAALMAAGYSVRGGEGQNTVGLTVERDREIVAWHSANHTDRPKVDAWREVHMALMQNLPLMDRYFVIDSGAAIGRPKT